MYVIGMHRNELHVFVLKSKKSKFRMASVESINLESNSNSFKIVFNGSI